MVFKDPAVNVGKLGLGEKRIVKFGFGVDKRVRKEVYDVRFMAFCDKASPRTRVCSMRGGRLAVLSDPVSPERAEPLKAWLRSHCYCFDEIHDASHMVRTLFCYDLILVVPGLRMPPRWVRNLCGFVEDSQSVLLIDKISSSNLEPLFETLGYTNPRFESIDLGETKLEVCKSHPVTHGLNPGDRIFLESCLGDACFFSGDDRFIIARTIGFSGGKDCGKTIPAIIARESGQGKIVHFNFRAEDHFDNLSLIFCNAIEWLLWN
jgi:hypothetical protein